MPATEFRMFFDNQPASASQLDQIEEIVVKQEVGMAWEARIKMPVCVNPQGVWSDEDLEIAGSFSRVRVEVKIGTAPFVTLIDGPVVADERPKNAQPGQSSITLVVNDDSVYLNRREEIQDCEDRTDAQIAEELLSAIDQISSTVIDDTPHPQEYLPISYVQRGTAITALRRLARNQGMYAYVLPGDNPGESIGHFGAFPSEPTEYPTLYLLGPNQNIHSFNISTDFQKTATARTSRLDIGSQQETTQESLWNELELLGAEGLFDNDDDLASLLISPGSAHRVDPERRSQIEAERASYSIYATGEVVEGCYPAVLLPYNLVTVIGVDGRHSGEYRIVKVTHTINRSSYKQSFKLSTNSLSEGSGMSSGSNSIGSIF